jgi:hypothetical protein
LGLDQYGQGRAYRNYFVTGEGTDDWPDCQALVLLGLMVRYDPRELTGNDYCFKVTDEGRAYVREHSPKPPKLTAGQRRYIAYLAADSGLSFGQWLKRKSAGGAA